MLNDLLVHDVAAETFVDGTKTAQETALKRVMTAMLNKKYRFFIYYKLYNNELICAILRG